MSSINNQQKINELNLYKHFSLKHKNIKFLSSLNIYIYPKKLIYPKSFPSFS